MYDLETFNEERALPYASGIYKLDKCSGKYHRDITDKEYPKGLNDCVVFNGTDCVNKILD